MSNLNVTELEPGVHLTETPTPSPPAEQVSVGVGALFGVANWGPVGEAVRVNSLAEWMRVFGGYISATYPSYKHVRKFFQNGGATLYFTRIMHMTDVTDPSTYTGVQSTGNIMDTAGTPTVLFVAKGKYRGATIGNDITVVISASTDGVSGHFKLSVKDDALNDLETAFDNLSSDPADSRYAPTVVNAGSRYIVLSAGAGTAAINTTQTVALASGDDGLTSLADADYTGNAVAQTGIHVFNAVDNPLVVGCPDKADAVVQKYVATWCDTIRPLNFGVLVIPSGTTITGAETFRQTTLNVDSPRVALYYQWIIDQEDGAALSPLGAIMGVYSRYDTDVNKGVWWSPAGTAAKLEYVTGVAIPIGSDAAGVLNEIGVNCLKIVPNVGVCVWGSRTQAITLVTDFKYIGARRNTSDIEARILANTLWAVHRPNDSLLWKDISVTVSQILNKRYLAGGLDGNTAEEAYAVKCDSDINTAVEKAAGLVVVQVGIRNKQTAEFVWFNVSQMAAQ